MGFISLGLLPTYIVCKVGITLVQLRKQVQEKFYLFYLRMISSWQSKNSSLGLLAPRPVVFPLKMLFTVLWQIKKHKAILYLQSPSFSNVVIPLRGGGDEPWIFHLPNYSLRQYITILSGFLKFHNPATGS